MRRDAPSVHAFIDGELDLERQIEFERRIAGDADLAAEVEALRSLRGALRAHAEHHTLPEALRARIGGLVDVPAPRAPRMSRWPAWQPLALALSFAALCAWAVGLALWTPNHTERLVQEAVASHVRSTLGTRLVDVASSDQHTVKPWLSARLDFSPPVHELHGAGASFVGGRLDYLDGHAVAALVYREREHVINAFVWPSRQADRPVTTDTLRGFNVVHWARAGMTHWLVSDLNRDELSGVARQLDAADAPR